MLIVGLTGGIACGKTTVSNRLQKEHGLTIVDADKIARDVVEPNTSGYKSIVRHFGPLIPSLLNEDGTLNRRELGSFVFANKAELAKLNSIVHPAVRWAMATQVFKAYFSGRRMIILDVPLLFESKLDKFCGVTILVDCPKELQIKRLLRRDPDLSLTDAENRISNQMSTELKSEKADVIIINDESLAKLEEQVDSVVAELTPSLFRTVLLLFPPLGFVVACWNFSIRRFKEMNTADSIKRD